MKIELMSKMLNRARPGGWIVIGVVLWVGAWLPAHAEQGPFDTRERLHRPLGPLAEAALEKLAASAEGLQRLLLQKHMDGVLDELKLSAEERAKLEKDAAAVTSAAVASWKLRVAVCLRPILPKYGDDAAQAARVRVWTKEQLVPDYLVTGWTLPEWLPEWQKALETHLGAARAAQWKKDRLARRDALKPQIDDFLAQWGIRGRQKMDEALQEQMPQLRRIAKLDIKGEADLLLQAKRLVDAHVASELAAGRDMLMSAPDSTLDTFLKGRTMNSRFIRPEAEALIHAWHARLETIIGKEAWSEIITAQKALFRKDLEVAFQGSAEAAREKLQPIMEREIQRYTTVLKLAGTRSKALRELSVAAIEDTLQNARQRWQKTAPSRPVSANPLLSRHHFSLSEEDNPLLQDVWLEGLQRLFTAAELQQIQRYTEDHFSFRQVALARVVLAEIDPKLGLTAGQRTALEPLLAAQMESILPTSGRSYFRVGISQLIVKLRQVPKEKVAAILSAEQMGLWSGLSTSQFEREPYSGRVSAAPRYQEPDADAAPPDAEALIAAFEHEAMENERARLQPLMQVQIDDARRLLKLPPEKVRQLTTAAKGAVQAALAAWSESLSDLVAKKTQDLPPHAVKQMLPTLRLPRARLIEPQTQPIWLQALSSTLSATDRATWEKVRSEREAYRLGMLAEMVVFELDRRRQLSPEQFPKVKELVLSVVKENEKLIHRAYGNSSSPWHLSSYTALLPLAAVKKEKLQSVLSAEQWKNFEQNDLPSLERNWQYLEMLSKMPPDLQNQQPVLFFNR